MQKKAEFSAPTVDRAIEKALAQLGLDRDSGVVSELFDERNDAVKALLSMAIRAAKKQGKYVGICGQGPSDHEDFAAWLMEEGIDSLSLNPDTVVQTWLSLAELKK